jgi:hypothetical protein
MTGYCSDNILLFAIQKGARKTESTHLEGILSEGVLARFWVIVRKYHTCMRDDMLLLITQPTKSPGFAIL